MCGVYIVISGQYKVIDEVMLYVGLVYEILLVLLVYVSYIEIFNLQNFKDRNENLFVLVQGFNLEVGIKLQWFDGCLIVNVVIFEVKQDNYVVCDMIQLDGLLSDGSLVYVGVNGMKLCGWEVDVNGQILLGWIVNVGYMYVKVICVVIDLIYVNLFEDFLQFNIIVQLFGVLEWLSLGGGFLWQSRVCGYNIFYLLGGIVIVNQLVYMLVNFNVNYCISDNWMVIFSVCNVLDKIYWVNLDYNNYGELCFVLVSLCWKF